MSEAINYEVLLEAFEAHAVERGEHLLRVGTLADRLREGLLARLGLRNPRDVYLVRLEDLTVDPSRRSVPVQKAVSSDRAVDLGPAGWAHFGLVIVMRRRPQDHPSAFTGLPLKVRVEGEAWELRCADASASSVGDEVGPLVDFLLAEVLRSWREGFSRWRSGDERPCPFGFYV